MTTLMTLQPWSQQISSLSNTTVVAIFTNVCLWRRSLCSNLAGIDREKLYRAIFICQYGLCCCICPKFCSTVLGNLQKFFGQMVYRPPWQKIARTPMPVSIGAFKTLTHVHKNKKADILSRLFKRRLTQTVCYLTQLFDNFICL